MSVFVVGIGQPLRGDDGAGPAAVRRWMQDHPQSSINPPLEILLLETPGLDLLDHFSESDSVILVDAVCTGQAAGTVRVFDPIPDARLSAAEKTAHGFGVAEAIILARKAALPLPKRMILIGIEGEQYSLGSGISDPVQAAIPSAAELIQKTVGDFLSASSIPAAFSGE